MRRILRLARPEAPLLLGGLIFLAIGSAATLTYPQGVSVLIDAALGKPPAWAAGIDRARLLEIVALAMAAVALVSAVAMGLRYFLFVLAGERVIARLRQDPPWAQQVLEKYLKIQDPDVLAEVYKDYLPKRVPLVVPDGLTPVLESIAERDPSALGADPRRFYDNRIVEELQRSGFIDALYR